MHTHIDMSAPTYKNTTAPKYVHLEIEDLKESYLDKDYIHLNKKVKELFNLPVFRIM